MKPGIAIGYVLSITWALVVVIAIGLIWVNPPAFNALASKPCPQLVVRPLPPLEQKLQEITGFYAEAFVWRDAKTRKPISLYRDGELALSCDQLESRANILAIGSKLGLIEPQLKLRPKVATLMILLPAIALYIFGALLQLAFFRKGN